MFDMSIFKLLPFAMYFFVDYNWLISKRYISNFGAYFWKENYKPFTYVVIGSYLCW